MDLQKGEESYRISRFLKVIKNEYQYEEIDSNTKTLKMTNSQGYDLPAGCEVIENESTFEILKKEKNQNNFHTNKKTSPNILINEILPETLSSYFILDGEFLEKFWSGFHKVKIGIEQISQLHLLNTTKYHLDSLKKSVPQIGSRDIDNLTQKMILNDHYESSRDLKGNESFSSEPRFDYDPKTMVSEYYHSTGKPRIQELEEDIERIKVQAKEILEDIGASNIDTVKALKNDYDATDVSHKQAHKNYQRMEKEYNSSFIENLPLFFLKPAIEYSIVLVDNLRRKGDLPYESKKIFTNDLLEIGKCICQADLESKMENGEESNIARLEVIKIRDNMAEDQGLDRSVDLKFYFEEKMLGNFNKFTKSSFDQPIMNLSNAKQKESKLDTKLQEIKLKMQNYSYRNEGLIKNHDHLLGLIKEFTDEINEIKYKLKEKEKENKNYRFERKNLMEKEEKARKTAHDQNVWEIIMDIFEKSHAELKQEIREEVQFKTMEIFLSTMYKQNKFKKFIIKSDYSVELIDQDDVSILGSLSVGESLFLALSFISAIRDVTGYKFPLIIDTPLGRVSGTPRYLLSQALPKYLPKEQIIFLATDTEFLNPDTNVHESEGRPEKPFGQLLEDHINVQYSLIRGMEENTASVVRFNPKWRKNIE